MVQSAELRAADTASSPSEFSGSIQYRRVYVPEARVGELARGYLPMKRGDFERLIDRLEVSPADSVAPASITRAEYSAQLDGQLFLRGEAKLEILLTSHNAVGMPLGPCRLAIGKPRWDEAEPRDAQIALSPEGQNIVLVHQTSILSFPWSLRGRRLSVSSAQFEIETPPAPSNSWKIELPSEMVLETDSGVVRRLERQDDSSGATTIWTIDLGGRSHFVLRLLPASVAAQRKAVTLFREALVHNLVPSAARLSAEWFLDVYDAPLNRLVVETEPDVELISASVGETDVTWVREERTPQSALIVLNFPEPIIGSGRLVRLGAIIPLKLGHPWRLPHLRPLGVQWQEGKTTLLVTSPLSIRSLSTTQCRVSKVGPLPSPSEGESIQLQHFSAGATAEIVVDLLPCRMNVTSGTTVRLNAAGMTSELVADFVSLQGESYWVEMDFPRPWEIESIEATSVASDQSPEDVLLDWSVTPNGPESQLLRVQLRKSVCPTRNVRLQVRAFRQLPGFEEQLGIDHLRFGQFRQTIGARHLVSVQEEPPLRFEFSGDSALVRLGLQTLPEAERQLFGDKPATSLFLVDANAERLSATIQPAVPRYAAEIAVTASLNATDFVESYRIRCLPDASHLQRFFVHLSQAREGAVQWQVEGDDERSLAARRLTEEERQEAEVGIAEGEIWELVLRRPQDVPVTIIGQRNTPQDRVQSIALAWLPNATSQTGSLEVRSSDGTPLSIDQRKLEPILSEPVSSDRFSKTRGFFRYDPQEPNAVTVTRSNRIGQPATAWVWSFVVTSHFGPDGALHTATYDLENTGRTQVVVRMPEGTVLRQIQVHGQIVELPAASLTSREFKLPLPVPVRFPAIRIVYSDNQRLPDFAGQLRAQFPLIDVPVLERRWVAWTAPGHASFSHRLPKNVLRSPTNSILRRLFGPLAEQTSIGWSRYLPDLGQQMLSEGRQQAGLAIAHDFAASLVTTRQRWAQIHPTLSWHELLQGSLRSLRQSARESAPSLLIDRVAMHERGIAPDTYVASEANGLEHTGGLAILKDAGLALVACPESLILTGTANLAGLGTLAQAAPYDNLAVPTIPGIDVTQGRFVDLDRWTNPASHTLPGRTIDSLSSDETWEPSWTAYERDLGDETDRGDETGAELFVYRTTIVHVLAGSVLLLAVAVVWWVSNAAPLRLVMLATIAGSSALLIPEPLVPMTSSAFLGVLLASGLVLLRAKRPTSIRLEQALPAAPKVTAVTPTTIRLMMIVISTAGMGVTICGSEIDASAVQAKKTPTVIIPVDGQRRPTGDLVYVQEPLYLALHQIGTKPSLVSRDWLLHAASYQGTLKWADVGAELAVSDFSAVFHIEVFNDDTRIVLPLQRGQLHVLGEQCTLDGRPIQLEWQPNGIGLIVDVERTGHHRLELGFLPNNQREANTSGLFFAIPALLHSQLKLSVPEDARGIEFPTAQGAVQYNRESGLLEIDLGSTNQLAIRWPTVPGGVVPPAEITMEQLLWLKVNLGTAAIDAKLIFNVPHGQQLAEIRLEMDPLLDLKLAAGQPVGEPVSTAEGSLQTIRIPLNEPITDSRFTLSGTFVISTATGVGRLRLPRITASAERSTAKWLAVTVSRNLQYQLPEDAGAEPAAVSEFVDRWGEVFVGDLKPQMVFRLSSAASTWTLATQPVDPLTVGNEQTELSVGHVEADLKYTCLLTTSRGYLFQHRLIVPQSVQVHSVSLTQNDIKQSVRWARSGDVVTVFCNEMVSGDQQLLLRGALSAKRRSLEVPQISCTTAKIDSSAFRVFRQPDIQVELERLNGFERLEDEPLHAYREGLGRLVASLRATGEMARRTPRRATLKLTPNRPRVRGVLVTELNRIDGEWMADLTCQIHVEQGIVDALRFDVPNRFEEPMEIEPTARLQIAELPGTNQRRLILWLASPIRDQCRVRFRGKLTGQRLLAPDIVPLDMRIVNRFLLLPIRLQEQQVQWQVSGAVRARLPVGFDAAGTLTTSHAAYRLVRPTFTAAIQELRQTAGISRIHLADVCLAYNAADHGVGIAMFDLDPAGRTDCTLKLPSGFQLVHVSVSGLPALADQTAEGNWLVKLGSYQLPQRMIVVFSGKFQRHSSSRGERRVFEAPEIVEIPVEQRMWTIDGPPGVEHGVPRGSAVRVDTLHHRLLRFRALAMLLKMAEDSAKERLPSETENWYRTWIGRYVSERETISQEVRGLGVSAAPESAELDTIEREQTLLAARLGMTSVKNEITGNVQHAADPTETCRFSLVGKSPLLLADSPGSFNSLEVEFSRPNATDFAIRLGAACVFFAFSALVYLLAAHEFLREWLIQWPYAAGVLFGLAWWLWLSPAAIGLLVTIASVLGSLRSSRM